MIGLAFLATVINYLDRQTLSVVAPVLLDEFGMNSIDYSRVVSVFLFAYTVSNGISGPLIDRLGTRSGYTLCMAWWSLSFHSSCLLERSSQSGRLPLSAWHR